MVHSSRRKGRRHYGPGSAWERPHNRGGPSHDPTESRELEDPGQAPRHQPENRRQVADEWRKRNSVADLPTGPKQVRSTVLSAEEEASVVAFRRHTRLPL